MPGFANLPSDLLSLIVLELSLADVLSVRQVSLSLVGATAVESWTRNAFVLERAYLSNNPLSVHHLKTGIRAVTWVKIIRGRWCLAASSNISESLLTLWDISTSDNRICAEMPLPGPIMDGEIEDIKSEIVVAVSVGCRERYVQMLTVGTSAGIPQILKLKIIPGADHVLCLRGPYLGVAVLDGNDSNPILLDWKHDTQWVLKPSVPITSLRNIVDRTTCLAMTIWDAFVIVAFPGQLRVYTYPERHGGSCELLCTHSILRGIEVRFVNNESMAMSFPDDVERTSATHLLVFLKSHHRYCTQALDAKGQLQGEPVECDVPQPPADRRTPIEMLRMKIGYTGRKFLGLISSSSHHCIPPRLLIAGIQRSQSRTGCDRLSCDNDICTKYHVVPTYNFPLLHFWSCFDFDDSRGVLLTGTTRGEICVARFVHGDIILPGSLMDELPPLHAKNVKKELYAPPNMDLPTFYQFRECIMNDDIPAHLVDQITYSWTLPGDSKVSAPGWSSDWRSFRNLKQWAMPSLRWGHMDPDMLLTRFPPDSPVNEIRAAYGYLGEPCPVVFQLHNPEIVIFRIGSQAFLMNRKSIYAVSLIQHPLQELSQLLQNMTVHEFNTILRLLSLVWAGTNIDTSEHDFNKMPRLLPLECLGNYFNTSDEIQIEHMQNFDDILQHVAMSEDYDEDPDPNNWTYNLYTKINFLRPCYLAIGTDVGVHHWSRPGNRDRVLNGPIDYQEYPVKIVVFAMFNESLLIERDDMSIQATCAIDDRFRHRMRFCTVSGSVFIGWWRMSRRDIAKINTRHILRGDILPLEFRDDKRGFLDMMGRCMVILRRKDLVEETN
ncbi:hypothetical protein BD410DRAFT_830161 [Rickenella mellea]|uniref:F-box domain-containing protein n=1 Tax=Rickenella mellea TaxID=50990 RepID=A0A4Y7PXB3_9AGAM|nr:hypothetical protein BD410DRAFT_830161 [Rickenella mellea]